MPEGKHSTVNYRLEALPVIDSSTRQKKTFDYNPTHQPLPPLDFRSRAGVGAKGQGPPHFLRKKD